MKTITYLTPDQQRKSRDWAKQNGQEYSPNMMSGEVHIHNDQEYNRHTLYVIAIKTRSNNLFRNKSDALHNIELRSIELMVNTNPRKLWRKLPKAVA